MRPPQSFRVRARACDRVHVRLVIALCVAPLIAHAARARADDSPPRLHVSDDFFIDAAGQEQRFRETYERMFGDLRPPPNYLRAFIETGLVLGVGTFWYWKAPNANTGNYDFNSPIGKLSAKGTRFDDNKFSTNMVNHPMAGGLYYAFARLNRVSIPISFLISLGYSSIYEYVIEWREKASINDMIVTPFSGIAVGECFQRLFDYMGSAPPGQAWGTEVARYALGWPRVLHEAMDGPSYDPLPLDSLGMSSAYYHLMHLSYSIGEAQNASEESTFLHGPAFESEIVAMPGFLQRGRFHLFFDQGNLTEMRFRLLFEPGGRVEEGGAWFHSSLFGYYVQDFSHPLRGDARALALSAGFSHDQSRLSGDKDEFSFVHFPGFAWDEWLAAGRLLLHTQVDVSLDFGAISPVAFPEWRAQNPGGTIKSVLSMYSYDFDWGASARLLLSLVYSHFEAGFRFSYGRYYSIQGADRYQEKITIQTASHDELAGYRAWLGYIPVSPLELRLATEARVHAGWEENVHGQLLEHRQMLELGLVF